MIVHISRRTHMCLACRIRLAKHHAPSMGIPQRVWESTSTSYQGESVVSDEDAKSKPSELSYQKLHNHKIKRNDRLPGFKSSNFSVDSEALNIDVLGKPADIMILRESESIPHRSKKPTRALNAAKRLDMLEAIESERGLPGEKEVRDNINELRPPTKEVLETWDDFDNLVRALDTGFTIPQLTRYIALQPKEVEPPESLALTESYKHVSSHTPWLPGIVDSKGALGVSPIRGYEASSYTHKQRLGLRIVRECWKLGVRSIEEGLGQLDIIFDEHTFGLLQMDNYSIFQTLQYHSTMVELERIETFHNRRTVRITSFKGKAEAIARQIAEMTRNICQVEIDLKTLELPRSERQLRALMPLDKIFTRLVLSEVGQLTKSYIKRGPKTQVIISSIEPQPEKGTATRADVAKRLLMTSSSLLMYRKHSLECRTFENSDLGMFVPYPSISGLPWRERLRRWKRWTLPLSKDAFSADRKQVIVPIGGPSSGALDIVSCSMPDIPFKQKELKNKQIKKKRTNSIWSETPATRTDVLLGKVLHTFREGYTSSLKGYESWLSRQNISQTFVASAPDFSRIIEDSNITSVPVCQPLESIFVRFLPNPWAIGKKGKPVGPAAFTVFPLIELEVTYGDVARDLQLKEMRAWVKYTATDLMLPDLPNDLRFQQQTSYEIKGNIINTGDITSKLIPGLSSFISRSKLDPQEVDQHIETPAGLTLPIGQHLCKGDPRQLLTEWSGADDYNVEYLYAGLEYKKTLTMKYREWQLIYSSIQAGKSGGRRQEVSLRPVTEGLQPFDMEMLKQAAFALAEGRAGTISTLPPEKDPYAAPPFSDLDTNGKKEVDQLLPEHALSDIDKKGKVPDVNFFKELIGRKADG